MSRGISGVVVLGAWLAIIAVAWVLCTTFITPPTDEARLVTAVLFGFIGVNATCAGVIVWARR